MQYVCGPAAYPGLQQLDFEQWFWRYLVDDKENEVGEEDESGKWMLFGDERWHLWCWGIAIDELYNIGCYGYKHVIPQADDPRPPILFYFSREQTIDRNNLADVLQCSPSWLRWKSNAETRRELELAETSTMPATDAGDWSWGEWDEGW